MVDITKLAATDTSIAELVVTGFTSEGGWGWLPHRFAQARATDFATDVL